MCGYGRGVVFELSENSGQLVGRVLVQVFAVFRCWFYIKKQIKDDLRSGQKPHEKRQQKSEKIPIKSRLFRIFLLTNNIKCDIIKMSREEGTPLLTEARRRKAVIV